MGEEEAVVLDLRRVALVEKWVLGLAASWVGLEVCLEEGCFWVAECLGRCLEVEVGYCLEV